jgi:hypothetical protein
LERDIQALIARLLAHRHLPREDILVRRALTDESFRLELDSRLAACGLILLDNPYADHVATGLLREAENAVFGGGDTWLNNNAKLERDGVALLVVLWALIILPKRERQTGRKARAEEDQSDMFAAAKPLPRGEDASASIAESVLLADFGDKLGGKMRINVNLGILARLGFIARRKGTIYEGPLLDLLLDYPTMEGRIIEGALTELLAPESVPSPDETGEET